jgi:hypothetical protein
MRAIHIGLFLVLVACATPGHPPPAQPQTSVVYDLDPRTMASIVISTSRANHYHIAALEPAGAYARYVVARRGATPLVVDLMGQNIRSNRFASCFGWCATSIAVTARAADTGEAQLLIDAISERARGSRLDN